MAVERIPVGVVVERRPATSRWQDHVWRVTTALPGTAGAAPWTVLDDAGGVTRYWAGGTEIVLHSGDTGVYRHNIESGQPRLYVVLRRGASPTGWVLLLATVDPSEAQAHAEAGDDLLEALPLPSAVMTRVEAFVAKHHVERAVWRRRRDRADPEALGRRRPAIRMGDGR
jgi:hypothetical protein